jgi:hypothetical protein
MITLRGAERQLPQPRRLGRPEVYRPVDLRQPQLHSMLFEQWCQMCGLAAVERSGELADHDRPEPTNWICDYGRESSGLRPVTPGDLAE